MDEARVTWTGKRQFVGVDQAGHSLVMDAKPEYRGEGSGIRPMELLLHGLAGCTGMDVVSILEKKRQDVRDLTITVRAHQRTDEFPKIYTRVEVEYVVKGFDIKPEALQRAIELSEQKYCSVKGMLGPQVEVVSSFRVEQAPAPGYAILDEDEPGQAE